MTNIIGRLESVGIGLESTRGTAVAPAYWLPVQDRDFDDKANIIKDNSGLGVLGEDSQATIQKQWADGSFNGFVYQNSIGVLLTLLSGQAPATSVNAGEYTHVFTQANNVTNKTGTICYKEANQDIAFANAAVDSMQFNFERDQFFNYEAQFISRKSASASNSVSRTAENVFAPKHGLVKVAAAQTGLDAANEVAVRSAQVTFAKNAEDKQLLGSVDIEDVHNRTMAITGSLEVYYDGSTIKDYVFDETERALRLGVENGDVTLADGSNPHLFFDFYRVRFHDHVRSRGNDDIVTETVEFTALVDFNNTLKQYTIELLNGVAGTSYGA